MIDWERVDDLRQEIGPADFAEIVVLFREEVEGVMSRLVPTADARRLEEDLHFLKGTALNLGFRALGQLCQKGERMAADGNPLAFPLRDLFAIYDASLRQFEARMS